MNRVNFRTTLEESLLLQIKVKALEQKVDVNDILEKLIEKYLNGETVINLHEKRYSNE